MLQYDWFQARGAFGTPCRQQQGECCMYVWCVCPIMRNLHRSFLERVGVVGEAWGAIQRWFLIAESALNFFPVNLF